MMNVNGLLAVGVFVVLVLQLAIIAMMQRSFHGRAVKQLGKLLENQNERIATELKAAIGKGSDAAHAAYKEANSVNEKIENLNKQLLKKD